ncbi:MAG: fibronectin type III domain-containing protein [Actinomycetales bacterium]|nr:fibronectin type III domain-containing protein [Actinomycetales bacterium]
MRFQQFLTTRGRIMAGSAAILSLLLGGVAPAHAAAPPSAVTATTSSSPTIGTVVTSSITNITVTMTANQAVVSGASAVTMTNPTTGAPVSTPWSIQSNGCNSKNPLASGATCTFIVRLSSAVKGTFAMRATFNYTVSGTAASTYVDFSATAATVPGAVSGLNTTVQSASTANVTWTAPADAGTPVTGYRINVTDTTTNITTDYTVTGGTTSYVLTDLVLGRTYGIKVFASNILGESITTTATALTFALPAPTAPTGLAASNVRSTSVTLSWNAASGFVDGYRIQASVTGYTGQYDDITTTANTSITLTDLDAETGYFFKVFAYNASRDGASTIVAVRTLNALPSAPTNVTVTDTTLTSMTVTWTAPQEDVTGYVVETSEDGVNWDEAGSPNGTDTTFTITGLDPDSYLFVHVYAFNDNGDGVPSFPVFASTLSGLPNPVTGFVASPLSETSVHLEWQEPAPALAALTGYLVQSRSVPADDPTAATDWEDVAELPVGTTSFDVTGVEPCISQADSDPCPQTEYRVLSLTQYGPSDHAETAFADPIFFLPGAAMDLTASAIAPGTVALTWSPAGDGSSPVSGYTVYYSANPDDLECSPAEQGGCEIAADSVDTAAATAIIGDLEPGTTYYFLVVTKMDSAAFGEIPGLATESVSVDVPTDITAVTGVSVSDIGYDAFTVTWDSMPSFWGATTYTVQVSADGGETWLDAGSTTDTSLQVTGLTSGVAYSVQVIADDGVLTTDPSDAVDAATLLAAAENLEVVETGEDFVNLHWDAPSIDAAVTGYRIEARSIVTDELLNCLAIGCPTGSWTSEWTEVDSVESNTSDYTHSGINPCTMDDLMAAVDAIAAGGAEFLGCAGTIGDDALGSISIGIEYRVVAFNDDTEAEASNVVSASTTFTLPGVVDGISAEVDGYESLMLSWNPAADGSSPVSGYTVYYSSDPSALECQTNGYGGCDLDADSVDTADTSVSIDGLDGDTTYYFVVVAHMDSPAFGDVAGRASDAFDFYVPMPLEAPVDVAVENIGLHDATVTWAGSQSGYGAVTYTVELSEDAGDTWTTVGTTEDTSLDLTDLVSGANYSVRVFARDDYSVSDASEQADFTTALEAVPYLEAAPAGEDSVDLAWDAPNGPSIITGYRIQTRTVMFSEAGGEVSDWETLDEVDASTTAYTVSGLQPCVQPRDYLSFDPYCPSVEYRVVAFNDDTEAEGSDPVAASPAFALPSDATDLKATVVASGTVSLTWEPSDDGSSPTSGYTVYYSTDEADLQCQANDFGGCDISADSVEADGTEVTIEELEPGTTYYFVVVPHMASTAFGAVTGWASDAASADVPPIIASPADVTVPDATIGFTKAVVTWSGSDSDYGPVTYTIQVSEDDGDSWTDVAETTDTEYTLTDLGDGVDYLVQVIAKDQFTTSEPSEPVAFTTKSRDLPDMPSIDEWSLDGSDGTVTFSIAGTSRATHLRYEARAVEDLPGGKDYGYQPCDLEGLTCELSGLAPGTPYRIIMRGFADAGHVQSAWSRFSIPDLELSVDAGPNLLRGTEITVEVQQLRPGVKAKISYAGSAQTVMGDDDGYASATFTAKGTGRKIALVKQGKRKASTDTWVVTLSEPRKIKAGKAATLKLAGAKPGTEVVWVSSVSDDVVMTAGSTGKAAFGFTLPTVDDSLDYSVLLDGEEFFSGSLSPN